MFHFRGEYSAGLISRGNRKMSRIIAGYHDHPVSSVLSTTESHAASHTNHIYSIQAERLPIERIWKYEGSTRWKIKRSPGNPEVIHIRTNRTWAPIPPRGSPKTTKLKLLGQDPSSCPFSPPNATSSKGGKKGESDPAGGRATRLRTNLDDSFPVGLGTLRSRQVNVATSVACWEASIKDQSMGQRK